MKEIGDGGLLDGKSKVDLIHLMPLFFNLSK